MDTLKKKNNKVVVWILIILFLLMIFLYFYISKKNTEYENSPVEKKTENQVVFDLVKKADDTLTLDAIKKNINDFDEALYSEDITAEDKASVEVSRALLILAKRDNASIIESISELKKTYINQDTPQDKKAVALEKLASLYWRTGGSEEVFREVYSGDFKKYADEVGGNAVRSAIVLYEKSYETSPFSRSAIEIAFRYSELGEIEESEKWLQIAENVEYSEENPNYYFKKFLTYSNLAVMEENKEKYSTIKLEELYQQTTKSIQNSDKFYHAQTLPFVYMAAAKTFNKLNNDKKVQGYLLDLISFIKQDRNKETSEFLYFLEIQKNKNPRDLLGEDLDNLAKVSPKFKIFLEQYGFVIN